MLSRFVVLVAAILVLAPSASAASLTRPEGTLLQEMNRVRAQHGLHALQFDARLYRASRFHTAEMLHTGSFAHGAFGSRMQRFSVRGSLAGENLAWGVGQRSGARASVAAWLASPEHRANLLRPSFRRVGVGELHGTFSGFRGAAVVTADFAG